MNLDTKPLKVIAMQLGLRVLFFEYLVTPWKRVYVCVCVFKSILSHALQVYTVLIALAHAFTHNLV